MKKYLSMIAFVMMAMMAFTLQSCGDDDDDDAYRINVSLVVTDRGSLTQEQSQLMINEAAQRSRTIYAKSKADADLATERAAQLISEELFTKRNILGAAVLSYKLQCREDDGDLVNIWYVEYDNGNIVTYDSRN